MIESVDLIVCECWMKEAIPHLECQHEYLCKDLYPGAIIKTGKHKTDWVVCLYKGAHFGRVAPYRVGLTAWNP